MTQLAAVPAASPALQKFDSVAKLLQSEKVQSAIARALPKHLTAERMIRVAMTAIQKVPKLAECDQRSLINAIVQCSELGLEPNTPLQHAYLIPFYNKNTKRSEVQVIPGYRGLIALARRSNQVNGIYAEIVYENDFFEVSFGLEKNLIHKPDLNREDRGAMIGAYAVAKFKDGYTDFEYMSAAEIEKIRKRSMAGDSGPWKTDTGEMWRKTPIRRLCKRLPMSIEDNTLQKAIEIDSYHDAGFDNIAPLEIGSGDETPEVITEEQRVLLIEMAKASNTDLGALIGEYGFELVAHVTVDKYDDILRAASPDVTHTDAQVEPVAETPDEEDNAPKSDESKRADLLIVATEAYRSLKANAKLNADKSLGAKSLKDLDADELIAFIDTFGN